MNPRRALAAMLAALACLPTVAETLDLLGCDGRAAEKPFRPQGYDCYDDIAAGPGGADVVIAHLEGALAVSPDEPGPRYGLARMLIRRDSKRAETLLREAADGFARTDESAEGFVRVRLARFLGRRLRLDEAQAEAERAEAIGARLEIPLLLAGSRVELGRQFRLRTDFGRAWRYYRQVYTQEGYDSLPVSIRQTCLAGLQGVASRTGRLDEGLRYSEQYLETCAGDPGCESGGLNAMIDAMKEQVSLGERDREDLIPILERGIRTAVEGDNIVFEVNNRCVLAEYLPPEESLAEFRRCLERSETGACHEQIVLARLGMARRLAELDPRQHSEALDLAQETLEMVRGTRRLEMQVLYSLAIVSMFAEPRERAIEAALRSLDAIENFRDLQSDDQLQEGTLYIWSRWYRLVAAYMLDVPGGPSDAEIESALQVMERMRARLLLEQLDRAEATASYAGQGPARERRERLLEEIASVQRELTGADLLPGRRDDLLAELERLEVGESIARAEVARDDPRFAALRAPEPLSLTRLRDTLNEGEALLSYQIGKEEDGGSWLSLHTRSSSHAFPFSDKGQVRRQVTFLLDLLHQRDGSEKTAVQRLYADLLQPALEALEPEVRSLIVVPDGSLHDLPFGALERPGSDRPLAADYAISIVPSATLWVRWRNRSSPDAEFPALALADPTPPGRGTEEALERAWGVTDGLQIGPLPHARREARNLRASLGRRARILIGDAATEAAAKTESLKRFGVLHIAAHALVDDVRPERSAVLLAPGADTEDGLLQIREIVDLDLSGRVVVLAACRSASGRLFHGEGVMGLARAFFQAGAGTVIGSRWPLRDDESAALFATFYDYLARGLSVDESLAAAKLERIRAGAPAAAWAGVALLGNGDLVPVPGGVPRSLITRGAWLGLFGLLAAFGLFLMHRISRRR